MEDYSRFLYQLERKKDVTEEERKAYIGIYRMVHQAAGFTHIGVMRSVGWKFGAWRDVVLMEKPLGAGDSTSPE